MMEVVVDADSVREVMAKLRNIDPKLVSQLRKELRGEASKVASNIVSNVGHLRAPLSNMEYPSPRALPWGGAKASVSISLRRPRGGGQSSLLSIRVDSPRGLPGYIVSEKAGSRGPVGTSGGGGRSPFGGSDRGGPQGANLIAVITDRFGPLKGKGGNRIAWKYFWQQRRELNQGAKAVIDSWSDKYSREL